MKNNKLLLENQIKKLTYEIQKHKRIALFKEIQMSRLKKEIRKFKDKTQEPQPEKRSSKRIDVFLVGEIIFNGKSILVLIDNISLNGIYIKVTPLNKSLDIPVGQAYELKFQLPSGEILNHNCIVKWLCKAPPYKVVTCIGSEIMNPTQKYKEFIRSLLSPRENIQKIVRKDKNAEKILR
ncbi:MAG: PilZ domain-containing protein [Promethearchaeota archaeon]|jgi:hypothetical protein